MTLTRTLHTRNAGSGDPAYRDRTRHVVGRVPSRGGDEANMRQPSANGACNTSLGQRPRNAPPDSFQALKGRPNASRPNTDSDLVRAVWIAPSGLRSLGDARPRALPWAGMERRVAAGETAR